MRCDCRKERLQWFLKPGALARMRDSKICARSPRSPQIFAERVSSPGSTAIAAANAAVEGLEGEQIRFFAGRMRAPRILQRKKLSAAKYVFFAPPSPDHPSDMVGVDLVAAH